MNYNKEAKSLTFRRGSEVSQDLIQRAEVRNTLVLGLTRSEGFSVWRLYVFGGVRDQRLLELCGIKVALQPRHLWNPSKP